MSALLFGPALAAGVNSSRQPNLITEKSIQS